MYRSLLTCSWGKTGWKHTDGPAAGVDLYTTPDPKMTVIPFNHLLLLLAVALLTSCGGTQPQQEPLIVDQQDTIVQNTRLQKTRKIFYNIPSPMETAALLKKAGAKYNNKILNDVKTVDRYTAASSQALNLGVYGADLSYASVFNQTQESMFYTAATQKLADRLGLTNAFDQNTLDRMEKNMNDRDSLLNIISETYWNMDAYLKENDRADISALMIAGGWIEGLYIATQVAGTNSSPELLQRIAEQKLSLKDLIALIDTYTSDDATLKTTRADLISLLDLFANVQPGSSGNMTQENGVTVIGGGGTAATMTREQFAPIAARTAEIRNKIIN